MVIIRLKDFIDESNKVDSFIKFCPWHYKAGCLFTKSKSINYLELIAAQTARRTIYALNGGLKTDYTKIIYMFLRFHITLWGHTHHLFEFS